MKNNETLPPIMVQNSAVNTEPIGRSPGQTLIMRKAINNAYNKSSMGSIPSSQSIILFYDPTAQPKKGFSSNSSRFPKSKSVINPYQYEIEKDNKSNYTASSNHDKVDQLNIDYTPRFDDKNLFISKHQPGPGQYNHDTEGRNKNNLRYTSLFLPPSLRTKQKSNSVGPDSYDIKIPQQNSNFYMSSVSRNDIIFNKQQDFGPGPGTYNIPSIVKKNNYNPLSIFKEKENVDLVEKYVDTRNIRNSISPGPGSYELTSRNENSASIRKKNHRYFSDIKTNIRQNNNLFKVDHQQTKNYFDSYFNKLERQAMIKALYSPERVFHNHHHASIDLTKNNKTKYPGPGYYNPTVPEKKEYNKNSENKWII